MSSAPQINMPIFAAPVRWTLRVLAWTAFAASAYLAWHAVTGTHVAGCGVGSANGCDMVLSSSWSKWLGVPVAVPGLACYAALAALSVLLGVRDPRLSGWIHTIFVMLAVAAAAASVWFLAIQVFAIGHYCRFCIVADLCGMAMGGIAVGWTARWLHATRYQRVSRGSTTNLNALRSALPTAPRSAPAVVRREYAAPSLALALSGAGVVVALLIGGQILFPAKSYELQQLALAESIEMDGADSDEPGEPRPLNADTSDAVPIPAGPVDAGEEPVADLEPAGEVVTARYAEAADESTDQAGGADAAETTRTTADDAAEDMLDEPPAAAEERSRERFVKFLDGKLTLDVYKHPLIGSPEAPHVLVEMVSYNCKHCRSTHRTMKQALSRYGDQVAVIVMVIPFERECNKLITTAAASHRGACSTARMALGVAALKPSAFSRFHDWLMADEEEPPPLDRIVARAYSLVDRDRLRELSRSEALKKPIEQYVNLFSTLRSQNAGNKEFGLPVQIVGDHVISGTVEKPADLYRAWEEHLGVTAQ
jgi:uncharacterized membrane protein